MGSCTPLIWVSRSVLFPQDTTKKNVKNITKVLKHRYTFLDLPSVMELN
jgi:hypothetical protein